MIRVVCSFSFIMNSVTLSDLVSNFIIHEWFIIWSNCNSLGRYIFDGQMFIHPSNKVEILNTHFSNIANIDNEPVISVLCFSH
jgi:hypothetical protein